MKQAFSMMSFGEIGGNEQLDANDALEQGEQAADRAIDMMEHVQDKSFLPEAYMVKATFFRHDTTGSAIKVSGF